MTNQIGAAIVDRIVQAFQNDQPFKVIVVMPAVPAFAGDLNSDDALGTRAIMEFQYNSICRGGHSILEKLPEAGIEEPSQYIGFYNLRGFDRINTSRTMQNVEELAGVSHEAARQQEDDYLQSGIIDGQTENESRDAYATYQASAVYAGDDTLDTISACYMDDGPNLPDLPWDGGGSPEDEINAFVTEELYIHSKLLIADDRLVICGSANLNDRSQLGTHDSEIAVVISDPTPSLPSLMNGESYTAAKFAASLRRFIFRKHLGLVSDQRWDRPGGNWLPVDSGGLNEYDWDSPGDRLVQDPLGMDFTNLWRHTANTNTQVFSKAFHTVPDNHVRNWTDYETFHARHFKLPATADEEREEEGPSSGDYSTRYEYGHIVREEFPGGVEEVKAWLGMVRGTLVEMPLGFLAEVGDIAKEGLTLNGLTDELYT